MLTPVCFVTAHPNPANHFVEYVQVCEERGIPCKVIAGQNVSDKFSHVASKVVVIDLSSEELLARLETELSSHSLIITDIANERWVALHQKLNDKYPSIKRAVYYDNPERHVPGGYSELAAKVIDKAQIILFANSSLVEKGIEGVELSKKSLIGLGYYPKSDANKILELRKNMSAIRSSFLKRHGIDETSQKILVYTGGANDAYYNKAFPHFIHLLTELVETNESLLENTVLILQQHPRAKTEGNLDAKLVKEFRSKYKLNFIVSDMTTPESLALADGVFYYQTSMAAQFVFAEIPSVIQVGHETYPDILVRAGFPSVTDAKQFVDVLSSEGSSADIKLLEKELGIDSNWKENLNKFVSEFEEK